MLNKEVCIECWELNGARSFPPQWTEGDEERWKRNRISCPSSFSSYSINSLPKFCHNGLEHIIANRQDEINKKEKVNVE